MNPPDILEVSGVQSYRRSCLERLTSRLTTFPSFAEGKDQFVKACLLTHLLILMREDINAAINASLRVLETHNI